MTANQLKHYASLEEWKKRIAECRSSGEPVITWCKERNISTPTYYKWEKRILEATTAKNEGTKITAIQTQSKALVKQQIAQLPVVPQTPSFHADLVLRIGKIEIEVANSISIELLSQIRTF